MAAGASLIVAVEADPVRTEMSKRMGTDIVLDFIALNGAEVVYRAS